MKKIKNDTITRKNRARTKRFQQAAKVKRERTSLMLELDKLEEAERENGR